MKTLDEVIEAEEICSQIDAECSICPYKATAKGWCEEKDRDALFYLKEYKKDREDPDGDHQQLEKCRALLQDFYRNDPLSWDELKQMEGKPVWVEAQYPHSWCIVREVQKYMDGTEEIVLDGLNCKIGIGRKEKYGTGWQAYRKER